MKRNSAIRRQLLVSLIAASLCISIAAAHDHSAHGAPPANLGDVTFEISCRKEVHGPFNRAIALVHSFWHDEAERELLRVATADPNCAMAWWGVAITHAHQILATPTEADRTAGNEALTKADAASSKTPREAAYIRALHILYEGFGADQTKYYAQATRYAQAMGELATSYPKDVEATAFYGLALIAAAAPDDVSLANLKKAVAVLTPAFRAHPDHPGLAHYIIHACDNPRMAEEGLAAARRYASIAPAAPHALHMPSHIFARLGLWPEDIRSNIASRESAERELSGARAGAEALLHALEFLEYAYLQMGDSARAQEIVTAGRAVRADQVDARYANYHATAQARYTSLFAIETQDWTSALRLEPATDTPWSSQQLTFLAHAMAAGHLRDAQAAKHAADSIDALVAKLSQPLTEDRATTIKEIHTWADFAQGDVPGAIRRLERIAERQAQTGKGEVEMPAREMLAQMLLLDGQAAAALKHFKASLAVDPNRFNALLGAGRAAEQLGQQQEAAGYYRTLLANCPNANGAADRLLEPARRFLNAQRGGKL
jgi:tetratricopeptide (TPR) repeat protein